MKPLLFAFSILLLAATACTPTPVSTPEVQTTNITVYFQNQDRFAIGTEPYEDPVTRTIPASDDIPAAVLEQLFLGPTPEEQSQGLRLVLSGTTGYSDFFIQDGVAHIFLTGACSSGGSTYTIANLIFANLEQFPEIKAIKIYDQNGETEAPDGTSSSIPFCLEP
jgi:spore germination protein GerM